MEGLRVVPVVQRQTPNRRLNLGVVWKTVTEDISPLKQVVEQILQEMDDNKQNPTEED